MKSCYLFIILSIVISILLLQPALAASAQVSGPIIPQWIKNNAKWWSDGTISDSDFVKGIQYLVQNGIVKVTASSGQYLQNSKQIPSWIKNSAGWWANGLVDDSDFVKGIGYLVQTGVIQVSISQPVNQTENAIPTTNQDTDQNAIPTFMPSG